MPRFLLFLTFLFLAACKYEVPLEEKAGLAIDENVTGHWQQIVSAGDETGKERNVLVPPYSDTAYVVVYHTGDKGLYFRGYPVRFNGDEYVQLQFVGVTDGVIADKHRKFDILRYEISGDKLSAWLLNGDLIDKDTGSSDALKQALRRQANNPELFKKLGEFRNTGKSYD